MPSSRNPPDFQTADLTSRYDTPHTRTHSHKESTATEQIPHTPQDPSAEQSDCPPASPPSRCQQSIRPAHFIRLYWAQPPLHHSLVLVSTTPRFSWTSPLESTIFGPPPPQANTPTRRPTNSPPTQLPLSSFNRPPTLFQSSLYQELFRPGHVRTLIAAHLRSESAQRASRALVFDPVAAHDHCSNWPVTNILLSRTRHFPFASDLEPPWRTPRDPLRRNGTEHLRRRRYP